MKTAATKAIPTWQLRRRRPANGHPSAVREAPTPAPQAHNATAPIVVSGAALATATYLIFRRD
jgi:hypothetical protein